MEPTGTVTFTVKELLERLDVKLDRLDLKLDAKAEEHDLEDAKRRLDSLERWRSFIAGGVVVAVALGAVNGIRIWLLGL